MTVDGLSLPFHVAVSQIDLISQLNADGFESCVRI